MTAHNFYQGDSENFKSLTENTELFCINQEREILPVHKNMKFTDTKGQE